MVPPRQLWPVYALHWSRVPPGRSQCRCLPCPVAQVSNTGPGTLLLPLNTTDGGLTFFVWYKAASGDATYVPVPVCMTPPPLSLPPKTPPPPVVLWGMAWVCRALGGRNAKTPRGSSLMAPALQSPPFVPAAFRGPWKAAASMPHNDRTTRWLADADVAMVCLLPPETAPRIRRRSPNQKPHASSYLPM